MMTRILFFIAALSFSLPLQFESPRAESTEGDKKKTKQSKAVQKEESEDYFDRWIKSDVVYIISPDEKAVFGKLTTAEEKEQFIEQFWYRRDPDPRSAANEFKAEHYRRIAYANERFKSGGPGWRSDRGRVYIIHGPADSIESHPSGGTMDRPANEGGGQVTTYPFEVWWYRHIDGIGSVELEFVDQTYTGKYHLAIHPAEKDALMFSGGVSTSTLAEMMGLSERKDHPYLSPYDRDNYPFMSRRMQDNPFIRYETWALVQRPPRIKYKDLQELVNFDISYNSLPFKTRQHYFRLNEEQSIVPITMELQNRDLTFVEENGVHVARIAMYGIVTSITNRIVKEFEEDLIISYTPEQLQSGLLSRSVYQQIVLLHRKERYKLDLVLKDLNSSHVGLVQQRIVSPAYEVEELAASSLILADLVEPLERIYSDDEMFVLGDVKVRPRLDHTFSEKETLGIYLQVYNTSIDQSTLSPSISVVYEITQGGKTVLQLVDQGGRSLYFHSGQRLVLLKKLRILGIEPGRYRMQVTVRDRISDRAVVAADDFEIVATPARLAANINSASE